MGLSYQIDEAELALLVSEGCSLDERGAGLAPQRRIVWITAERAQRLQRATELEMRLDAAMLGAPALALVAFRRP